MLIESLVLLVLAVGVIVAGLYLAGVFGPVGGQETTTLGPMRNTTSGPMGTTTSRPTGTPTGQMGTTTSRPTGTPTGTPTSQAAILARRKQLEDARKRFLNRK